MSVVKQYYGFKERMREKRKSVLWEAEKMANKADFELVTEKIMPEDTKRATWRTKTSS